MHCPFCFEGLKDPALEENQFGINVLLYCKNPECEESQEKTFFINVDGSDIQY